MGEYISCEGTQFYIVQGRTYSPSEITNIGISKKITYSEAHIKKYSEVGGTPQLDMDYTVFGELTKGMEVIDKIAAVQTGLADRPVQDVKMKIKLLN